MSSLQIYASRETHEHTSTPEHKMQIQRRTMMSTQYYQ